MISSASTISYLREHFLTRERGYLSTFIACINQPLPALRALLSTANIVVQAVIPARAILVRAQTGLMVTPSGPMMIMATGRPAAPPPPPMPPPPLLACSD